MVGSFLLMVNTEELVRERRISGSETEEAKKG